MNVLLTCAGRRNYLVTYFKQALGDRGAVLACDSSADAPALRVADRGFVVPAVSHPDYFDTLASMCRQQDVRLLIAVLDLELDEFSRRAAAFREFGTICVISSPRVIATTQDKWRAFRFMREFGIPTPATYGSIEDTRRALAAGEAHFPLLIKPRWGVSSIGVEWIDNDRQLTLAYEWGHVQLKRTMLAKLGRSEPGREFIFQEGLHGAEYGMDVVNDLDGRYVATLARRKLSIRGGNTDRAVTVNDPRLARLGEQIGSHLGHIGCLDCDLLETDTGFKVLDLNPRFGGGYPFSHCAGANLPAALIAWADGVQPDPAWFTARPGVTSAKYDEIALMGPTAVPGEHLACASRK